MSNSPSDAATQAAARIRAALADNGCMKGWRGPKNEQQHVEVLAQDVVLCAEGLDKKTEVQAILHRGCKIHDGRPEAKVTIQADDAFHLIESFQETPAAA